MDDELLSLEEMAEMDTYAAKGISRKDALAAVGISRERFHDIEKRAAAGDEMYSAWLIALAQAQAKAKVVALMKLSDSPDWRCQEKLLKMNHPELFEDGGQGLEHTIQWVLRVVREQHDKYDVSTEVTDSILERLSTEDAGSEAAGSQEASSQAKLH